jgi:hypothetical protein
MSRTQYPSFFEPLGPPDPSDLEWRPKYPDKINRKFLPTAAIAFFFFVTPLGSLPETNASTWLPEYPDFARTIVTDPSRAPYLFFTEVVAPAAPDLSWKPNYPDKIDRPTFHTSQQQAVAHVNPITPGLSDSTAHGGPPTYAIAGPHVQYQSAAAPVLVVTEVVPDQFYPSYPDRIDKLEFLPHQQQFFAHSTEPFVAELPERPPFYPDRIDRLEVHASDVPFFFSPEEKLIPSHISERPPVYPERIDRKEVHPSQVPSFFFTFALAQLPVPDLSWKGVYPDKVDPVVSLATASQRAHFGPEREPTVAAPDLSWEPQYEDIVRSLKTIDTSSQKAYFAPEKDFPPRVSEWEPDYQDHIDALVFNVSQQQFLAQPEELVQPPTVDSWAPTYPGYINVEDPVPKFEPFFFTFALAQLPVPDLSWKPTYPSKIDPLVSLDVSNQQFIAIPEELVQPPTLDGWKPSYPDRIEPPAALASHAQRAFFIPERQPDPPELSWSPVYPNRVDRLIFRVDKQQWIAVPEEAIIPPRVSEWLGIYPAFA